MKNDHAAAPENKAPRRNFYGRRQGRPLRENRKRLVEELLPRLAVRLDGVALDPATLFPGKTGVWKKQMDKNVYAEVLSTVVRSGVLDPDNNLKRGTCLKDRPMLSVMRSSPDGQNMLIQSLNSGCEKHADAARDIEKQFIDWTDITPWLAPK